MHDHVKYWVRPDIENRIKAAEITAHFNSTAQEIALINVVCRLVGSASSEKRLCIGSYGIPS